MSELRAVAHFPDGTAGDVDPISIDGLLRGGGALLWLDIQDPTESDIALLRAECGFHELALEDAARRGQRPKVDEYEGYYFIVLYSAEWGDDSIRTHELHCFWGKDYFVTLHDGPVPEVATAVERWRTSRDRAEFGVAFQVYALLDAVIDGYFPVLDGVADRAEDVENRLFVADPATIREVFALRRELLLARRLLAPSRDVLNVLIRRDVPVFPPTLIPYLTDVYDHTIRVIDALDLHRDLLATAVETHLTVTSNRLNQTIRTLAALTIGIMVPTLIAGIYGMNFSLRPSNEWEHSFGVVLALMAAAAAIVLAAFRRINWL
jgi:magnesium transporter